MKLNNVVNKENIKSILNELIKKYTPQGSFHNKPTELMILKKLIKQNSTKDLYVYLRALFMESFNLIPEQESFPYLLAKTLIDKASIFYPDKVFSIDKGTILDIIHASIIHEMADEKFLETSAGKIAYLESKQTDGKTVLLIHSNSTSKEIFLDQFLFLTTNGYHFIAIDLPGHGNSDYAKQPEKTYSFSGYAGVTIEVIKQLNLQGCIVFGWSLGGHCAVEILRQNPELTDGIVITGAPPINLPNDISLAFNPPSVQKLNVSVFYPEKFSREEAEVFTQMSGINPEEAFFAVKAAEETDGNARKYLGSSIFAPCDQKEVVENASIPVTIIVGNQDENINSDYMHKTFSSMKTVTVYGVDAGHACLWGRTSDEFNKHLKNGIEMTPPSRLWLNSI